VHQFKIASLELERTRRTKDLTTALARVAEINKRLTEIEAEMEQHRLSMPPLAVTPQNVNIVAAPANTDKTARPEPARPDTARASTPSGKRRTLRY
jgi:hypothetical protein